MKLLPVVAGSFYPETRKGLLEFFEEFERGKKAALPSGQTVGMLLPHAGYPYSGALAALGYRSLEGPVETVVVAGPSHYVSFRGVSLFAGQSVVTPLGEIPVDQEACRFLMDFDSRIAEITPAFSREHSAEVHFPLIQRYLPSAKIVPIVMGQGKEQAIRPLAEGLLALWKKKPFLFVASSDLSHYPLYDTAVSADHQFLEAVLSGDERQVEKVDQEIMGRGYPDYYCTHCGREPVAVLLKFAKGVGADKIKLLDARNSGDVTGDHHRVVGYGAVVFVKSN
ncbi:MAG TPA: AmmeMemoRadiSam system protein B [bacterium]|nr:AmmeMemoRadiSam system protein B [bacterium]